MSRRYVSAPSSGRRCRRAAPFAKAAMARKPRKYKGGEREAPTTGNRRCLRTGKARRPSKGRNGVGGQRLNARRTERFLRPCGFALRSSKTNGAASVGESARHQRPRSLARLTRPAGEFHRARRRVVVYAATCRVRISAMENDWRGRSISRRPSRRAAQIRFPVCSTERPATPP